MSVNQSTLSICKCQST